MAILGGLLQQPWNNLQLRDATMDCQYCAQSPELIPANTASVLVCATVLAKVDVVDALTVAPVYCNVHVLLPADSDCQELRGCARRFRIAL